MQLSLIVSAFLFVGIYEWISHTNINPKICAAVMALVPYLLSLVFRLIYGLNPITLADIIILALQFIVAIVVFGRSRYFESIMGWFFWGLAGFIVIIVIIPGVVSSIIH